MEKEGQLSLLIRIVLTVIFLIYFTGCAEDAPKLPKDYYSLNTKNQLSKNDFTSEQLKLSCQEISKQLSTLEVLNKDYQSQTKNVIHGTQVIRETSHGSVYSFPLLLPVDTNSKLNSKINKSYNQADILYKLQAYKNCKE